MPYIKQERREIYDNFVGCLIDNVRENNPNSLDATYGDLNYIITKLISGVYKGKLCYSTFNGIIGMLECCKQEVYRRRIGPYEDVKAKENGDVD
jgi:hypothetical protein